MQDNHGAILLISGPSGCGKSTLLKEVYKDISEYYFSISTTTRAPREGEKNGVDYFFVSKEDFEKDIKDKNFLEYANVHGNYYGTSLKPVKEALKDGKLVIFDIDVQGHDLVKKTDLCSFLTSVFITTPTLKELESRLNNRATDSKDIIAKRVKNAKIEINSIDKYDYFLINDNLDDASKKLVSIANAARIKASLFNKKQIISEWMN
ncbi:deoxyguanylate kinase / guanylate kinase [Malaciobacter marinus]|uniref:Guanylate kinase n=1 Tax=Malaciobacter marinus TaxID=505249 RepID=A0A347TIJ3_9BACT|nr:MULTISPECIES: guanylate kinase [Malaciobacter]AXX86421.1 deoxyguanylate kinase / guanylate kinase [Malaciobacter marinus]PHO15490.1 guanylate kinase [Malaciobacter marinus]RYA23387.1 guanylate kinase [Malaciobacter halophilus]